MEDKSNSRANFKRLAEARMDKALRAIRLIGNLSNRSNYTYTDEEVKKLVKALDDEVRLVKSKFSVSEARVNDKFKLV
jgi:hypothetical protein